MDPIASDRRGDRVRFVVCYQRQTRRGGMLRHGGPPGSLSRLHWRLADLLLGVLSILSGLAYTGGPLPIAYTPFGELFVVAFFGVGAVCGTYWLCTASLGPAVMEAGFALGLLAGAVLLVNNFRDAEADARVGRKTLQHHGRTQLNNLDLHRIDGFSVCAAARDRSRSTPRPGVAGAPGIARLALVC